YFDPAVGKTEGEALRKNLGIAQDDLVIGFVGRLVRDKGLIELHEAWLTLKNEFPNLHLVLAGPLESEDPLPDDVVQSFESDPRVHLM
ncbi:glycosyltransferase, partial [Klebsiella pneumoniae]|uniref:glycosyltransferase n=1 Tax=Klebsiella pneumoniae TaxID=573 RepID=UPI0038529395